MSNELLGRLDRMAAEHWATDNEAEAAAEIRRLRAELEEAHEARRMAQAESAKLKGDVLKIASAITNAGFTLVRTEHGYQVRKFGPATATLQALADNARELGLDYEDGSKT